MLQAVAVDLAERGENPRAFALAPTEGAEGATRCSWKFKGIQPILYTADNGTHRVLHETLRAWAEKASDGLLGRRNTVATRLDQPPPGDHGEVVDQVVWALQDGTGATAKYLAELKPSPSPARWLSVLDENGLFSLNSVPLVARPGTPAILQSAHPSTWHLARWLVQHLDEVAILDWALAKGGSLHTGFRWLVREALKQNGASLPPEISKAWAFMARHSVDPMLDREPDLLSLTPRINAGCRDIQLTAQIASIVEPRVTLKRNRTQEAMRNAGLVVQSSRSWELDVRFSGGDATEYFLESIRTTPNRDFILASLLDDCTAYVRRVMEVLEYFELASSDDDLTYIWIRSIDDSSEGYSKDSLAPLIALTAACVDSASRVDPQLARCQVDYWKTVKYPVFRRLVCFALARPHLFAPVEALRYVLESDTVFWDRMYRRELQPVLTRIWPLLGTEESQLLVHKILTGPSPNLYRHDLSADQVADLSRGTIAERLLTLEATGRPLPTEATAFLTVRKRKRFTEHAELRTDQEPPLLDLDTVAIAEMLRNGLPPDRPYYHQWNAMVSDNWPKAFAVLNELARSNSWPSDVWAVALSEMATRLDAGTQDDTILRVLDLIVPAPEAFIAESIQPIALLLYFLPKAKTDASDSIFWPLWDRACHAAPTEPDVEQETCARAQQLMSTAVGRLTEALFEWVGRRPEAEQAEAFWTRLDTACRERADRGLAARAVAACRLVWIFERRPDWTSSVLLPCFDWAHPGEATVAWQAFSFRPFITVGLWPAIRKDFIGTLENGESLDEETVRILYQVLGRIAVHDPSWLSPEEAQRLVTRAPGLGRQQIAWAFWRNLDAAGDKSSHLWKERIGPWIKACWQPDDVLKDGATSASLVRAALAAGEAFPEAVELVVPRLGKLDRADATILAIDESKVCEEYPQAMLRLLDRIIKKNECFYMGVLGKVLKRVVQAWPDASRDARYVRLAALAEG